MSLLRSDDVEKLVETGVCWSSRLKIPGLRPGIIRLGKTIVGIPDFLTKLLEELGIGTDLLGTFSKIHDEFGKNVNEAFHTSLRNAVKILEYYGVKPAYLDNEPDSGLESISMGYMEDFKRQARETGKMFKEHGVRKLITLDPMSAATMTRFYPRYVEGFNVEVKHISQFLAETMRNSDVRTKNDYTVTIFDPCYLTRWMGDEESIRRVLKTIGIRIIECDFSGKQSLCCGGSMKLSHPTEAKKIAEQTARTLLATGADKIVTACGFCRVGIKAAIDDIYGGKEVIDIVDVVNEAVRQE